MPGPRAPVPARGHRPARLPGRHLAAPLAHHAPRPQLSASAPAGSAHPPPPPPQQQQQPPGESQQRRQHQQHRRQLARAHDLRDVGRHMLHHDGGTVRQQHGRQHGHQPDGPCHLSVSHVGQQQASRPGTHAARSGRTLHKSCHLAFF